MGIAKSKPLLLQVCEAGLFGISHPYENGAITEALFTYLSRSVNEEVFTEICGPKYGRHLVCLSDAWENFIKQNCPDAKTYTRFEMKPAGTFKYPALKPLPENFELKDFGEQEFEIKPFSPGEHYISFQDFKLNGSGAAGSLSSHFPSSFQFQFLSAQQPLLVPEQQHRFQNLKTSLSGMAFLEASK